MTAIPAWPPKSLPRLFVRQSLTDAAEVELDPAQANYLGNVLRRGIGDEILLFDGKSGEWLARIAEAARKRMTVSIECRTRGPETLPDLLLAFAPVKRTKTDWLVEKATELGVASLQPVMTARTIAERVKTERLRGIAIEAAEQCGRTLLPEIAEPMPVQRFVEQCGSRRLYFADENGGAPVAKAFEPGSATILIGPEGGWTEDERTLIRAAPGAIAISLGPRMLRSETAALSAVTAYMALAGDWRAL